MKRPKKIIKFFQLEEIPSEWVDWNGKKTGEYIVKIPYWLGRAYSRNNISQVKVTFLDKVPSSFERGKLETKKDYMKFWKENYRLKVIKMRKLNNNYMRITNEMFNGFVKTLKEKKVGK